MEETNLKEDIKNLDKNIINVVSREDGTLEVYVKKDKDKIKEKVIKLISHRNLFGSLLKIDFYNMEDSDTD